MPRFSIVIPTRQRADTLRFAVETALAQTHPDFEVVVQNNGNDQATNEVVAAFASPRIVLSCSPNTLPYSANFEAALAASSGEIVAFIGDDDGMMPDACAIADAVMSSRPSLGALHWAPHNYDWPGSLRVVARNRLLVNLPGPVAGTMCSCRDLLRQLYDGTLIWTSTPLIYNAAFLRRSVIDKVKAFCGGQYFAGPVQDVHSGIANLWAMDEFLHIDRPLSICGASGHSNGNALFIGSDGVPLQKRYHAENPELRREMVEYFIDTANLELTVASALITAKKIFFKDDPDIAVNMRNVLLRMGLGANRDPGLHDQTIAEMRLVGQKYGVDTNSFNLPPKRQTPDVPFRGPVTDASGRTTCLAIDGEQAGIATVAEAVRLAASMLPASAPGQLDALLPRPGARPAPKPMPTVEREPSAELRVPHLFWGLKQHAGVVEALNTLVAHMGDTRDPWFLADNLITYSHSHGFLTEPRFVAAVTAEQPSDVELAIVWRTHTLCWSAESCLGVAGDFVECGSYQGYSMAVMLRFLAGLPDRQCFLYDLFDPSGGAGEGKRLPAHAPELFEQVRARFRAWPNVRVTRGKVPDVLAEGAPRSIAFLHVDMNNPQAERGALEVLFERISPGGMVVFDDYGWAGYRDQKLAVDEFMRDRGHAVLELPTGQGLVVKRPGPASATVA
jgi:glycosyltransferase involved in cell wall biosynthesis